MAQYTEGQTDRQPGRLTMTGRFHGWIYRSKYVPWSPITSGVFSHQFADGRAALISSNFHVVSLGNSMG